MQILVNTGGIEGSDALVARAEDEVQQRLSHFREHVTRVEVHFHDLNGPKSGVDKRVTMEARIKGQEPLAVHDEADDMYLAVNGAADKLGRLVQRTLERLGRT